MNNRKNPFVVDKSFLVCESPGEIPDLQLHLSDKRMPYHAGSGHDGKHFLYEKSKFFCDLEALVKFVDDFKTMKFDVLIAGGCSKHHMTLIPLFPDTVHWIMYETELNQDKGFMLWEKQKANVHVCSRYLTSNEAKKFASRDPNRPLLFLVRLDTMKGHTLDTIEDTVKRDIITRENLTKAVRAEETYLRFRLPFPKDGESDEVRSLNPDLILKNVYSRPNSTEITIMVKCPKNGEYESRVWHKKLMEEIMSRHNNVQRKLENFDEEASKEIWEEYGKVKQLYQF
jgi:hypothetical protein